MASEALRGKRSSKRFIYSLLSLIVLSIAFSFKALFPAVFIQENLSVMMMAASIYLINITMHFLQRDRE